MLTGYGCDIACEHTDRRDHQERTTGRDHQERDTCRSLTNRICGEFLRRLGWDFSRRLGWGFLWWIRRESLKRQKS
jgi:hypothetical protein